MKKLLLAVSLLLCFAISTLKVPPIAAPPPVELWVPVQYPTIQEAIDAANKSDIINVVAKSTPYYENITIDKSVTMVGHSNPVIDGGDVGFVVDISRGNVHFSNFTVQGGTVGIRYTGFGGSIKYNHLQVMVRSIRVEDSSNLVIEGNDLNKEVILINSSGIHVVGNNIRGLDCIFLFGVNCQNNVIYRNMLDGSSGGSNSIRLQNASSNTFYENWCDNDLSLFGSHDNTFYHNYFSHYSYVQLTDSHDNLWDIGFPGGGNFWWDHESPDVKTGEFQNVAGKDGLCDLPYDVYDGNIDRYPLKGTYNSFSLTHNSTEYSIDLICNSTVTDFNMCIPEKNIRFNVTGYGEAGFCRIRIPTTLMDDPYTVFVNGSETIHHLLTVSNGTYSFLYFTYHHSTQEVIIIYETLSYQLLFLFMIAAMAGVIVYKKSTCAN